MKKRILILPLLTLLLSGVGVKEAPNKYVEVKANETPMPTKINMENSTDPEVRAYYDGVDGLKGEALLGHLYTKIKDHNEYNYDNNTHRYIYKIIDRNWDLDAIDTVSPANTENFNYAGDNGFIRKLYADYNDDINTADRFK
ncbi:MAG: hypothetical protein WC275_04295, partial [Bacilli bacterium]